MHHSRLCAVLIDCRTPDLDGAVRFWGEALGRPVDPDHPGSRGNYRMLQTRPTSPSWRSSASTTRAGST